MTKIIIFEDPEFGLVERYPNPKLPIEDAYPKGVEFHVINFSELPKSQSLRDAWKIENGGVVVDLPKARELVHAKRRKKRDQEFEPLDRQATVPSMLEEVEEKRQVIRSKYDELQNRIEDAVDDAALQTLMDELEEE